MSTLFTILIISSILILGILIGMWLNENITLKANKEVEDKPTPQEFLQQFEEFLNSKDEELDDYDKGYEAGWLSCEKELKQNYELTPRIYPEDIVAAVREIDKIQTEEN